MKFSKKLNINIFIIFMVIIVSVIYSGKIKNTVATEAKEVPIYRVCTEEKKVALTFDVNWAENEYIYEILDVLNENNAKGTFFIMGGWVNYSDENREKLMKINDGGHEIGNHSYIHPSFTKINHERMADEIKKTEDCYTKGREKVSRKLPEKAKKYKDYIFVLPDIAALIYRLLKDKRVSMKTKLVISGAVAYITIPSDLIPDKVPFVGKIDDIAIGIFALNVIMTDVPLNIIMENWQGKNDILVVVKNVIEYATNFTGAKNIDSIYRVMEEILSV